MSLSLYIVAIVVFVIIQRIVNICAFKDNVVLYVMKCTFLCLVL